MTDTFALSSMSAGCSNIQPITGVKRGSLLKVTKEGRDHMIRIYDASSYVSTCGVNAAIIRTMQTAALSHPNILRINGLEMVFNNGCSDVVQPKCRAAHLLISSEKAEQNLQDWIRTSHFTGPRETVLLMNDVAQGVAYLHRNQYVHPKLYSKNVVVFCENGVSRAQVADFQDLTIFANEQHYRDEDFEEDISPYRAPEILTELSRRAETGPTFESDVWALGIMFFEILFRRTPFGFDSHKKSRKNSRVNAVLSNIFSWLQPIKTSIPADFSVKKQLLNSEFTRLVDASISQETFVLMVDLIDQCLQLRPSDRITAQAILNHPLFRLLLPDGPRVVSGAVVTTPMSGPLDTADPLFPAFKCLRADIVRNANQDVVDKYMEYDATLMAVTLFDRVMPAVWNKVTMDHQLDPTFVRHLFCACYLLGLKLMSSRDSTEAFACLAGVICAHTKNTKERVAQLERFIIVEMGCALYPTCILRTRPPLQALIDRMAIV